MRQALFISVSILGIAVAILFLKRIRPADLQTSDFIISMPQVRSFVAETAPPCTRVRRRTLLSTACSDTPQHSISCILRLKPPGLRSFPICQFRMLSSYGLWSTSHFLASCLLCWSPQYRWSLARHTSASWDWPSIPACDCRSASSRESYIRPDCSGL